uniref:Uncharacterized protein n=1 Tax=Rhizophora mucronata TaxID=61149 RepID=A0A2P2J9B4_RHIMU
MKAFPLSVL